MRWLHRRLVFSRRLEVLADRLSAMIPVGARVLDVGCGSGEVAQGILARRADIELSGIDVLVRARTAIPVKSFDGQRIPLPDASVDLCLLVDVLHHTHDPRKLLQEAFRVSRAGVLIKDHLAKGALAGPTLHFMDWVGNAPHGVALPYNYLDPSQWRALRESLGVVEVERVDRLNLYGRLAGRLFDRELHFIARWT